MNWYVPFVICFLLMAGCQIESTKENTLIQEGSTVVFGSNVQKVEILYVYQVPGCFACTTAGKYTEKLVNETFQTELNSGKLEFMKIDLNDSENKDILGKYGAQYTGIYVGVYADTGFTHFDYNYNMYLDDETQFRQHLKEYIVEKMGAK